MKNGIRRVLVAVFLLWEIPFSFSDVLIEQQVKDRDGIPSQVRLYYSEDVIRTDHPESGLTAILHFRNDQIFLINHRTQTFFTMKLSLWEKEMALRRARISSKTLSSHIGGPPRIRSRGLSNRPPSPT